MPELSDSVDVHAARVALRACPLLSDAVDADIAALAADVEWVRIGADELLFAKGDPGDSLTLVVSGRMVVYDPNAPSGELEVWGQVLPGEFVGILSVMMDSQRPASCRAQRDSVLLRIPKERFLAVAHDSIGTMRGLNHFLVKRFQEFVSGRRTRQSRLVVGLIPVSAGAPIDDLSRDLVTEMASFGAVLHLRDTDVQAVLGRDPRTIEFGSDLHARLSRWLLDQESRHDVIVLQASIGDDNWTRLCVRQADTVLMVARADEQPGSTPVYERLHSPSEAGASDRRELMLVHPAHAAAPHDTRRWLEALPVDMHHQVHRGRPTDLRRVARFLTGNAISLSLSGGASRAFAHVGVLRAMEELSIPVDMVCGSSLGALVGGLCALDWTSEEIRRATRKLFVEESIYDFTVPIVSTIKGKRYERYLDVWFQGTDIEDLWLPFFCISSDLCASEPIVHERGSAAFAIRCSGSVPGLFPPVPMGERLLVDGGMLDNLPAERALRRASGKSIAVSVIQGASHDRWAKIANARGPLQAARETMSVFRRQWIPPFMEVIMQSTFMTTISAADKIRAKVDLFIEPSLGQYGFLDASVIDEVVEVGYREGLKQLTAWRERDPSIATL